MLDAFGQRETDRDRQRQAETDRDRQRQTETDKDRQRQTETDIDRQRQTETDREGDGYRHSQIEGPTDSQRIRDRIQDRVGSVRKNVRRKKWY